MNHDLCIRIAAAGIVALAIGCAASAQPPDKGLPIEPPRPEPGTHLSPAEDAGLQDDSGASRALQSPAPSDVQVRSLVFQRELQSKVHSLAVGPKPWVAAIGEQPWLFDGKAWREIGLPESVSRNAEGIHLEMFFGRDDKPRVMGTRRSGGREIPVYLRWRGGRWQTAPEEMGRLVSGTGALYGILGAEDPEVACKAADACIIKRLTGWTTLPAHPKPIGVSIGAGDGYAFEGPRLMRAGPKDWLPVAQLPEAGSISTIAVIDRDSFWVNVDDRVLYDYSSGSWTRFESPVQSPRGLWASGASDVWVAGANGVGHFDGQGWSRVAGLEGPLSRVGGRGPDDVYCAGETGVWRGTPGSAGQTPEPAAR